MEQGGDLRPRSFAFWVLFRRGSYGGEDFFLSTFHVNFGASRATDQKIPVVAVVEVEEHGFPRLEHIGNQSICDARVWRLVVAGLTLIGEKGVAFGAVVWIFQIVAKLEGVIESKADRVRDDLSEFVEGPFARKGDGGNVFTVLDGEGEFFHGVMKLGRGLWTEGSHRSAKNEK